MDNFRTVKISSLSGENLIFCAVDTVQKKFRLGDITFQWKSVIGRSVDDLNSRKTSGWNIGPNIDYSKELTTFREFYDDLVICDENLPVQFKIPVIVKGSYLYKHWQDIILPTESIPYNNDSINANFEGIHLISRIEGYLDVLLFSIGFGTSKFGEWGWIFDFHQGRLPKPPIYTQEQLMRVTV